MIPNPLSPTSNTRDGVTRLSEAEGLRIVQEAARRAKPPEPVMHPCVVLSILDEDALREVDPLVLDGAIAPLWGLSEPTVIRKGDVEVLKLTPAERGAKPTLDLPLELYELICESAGVDPVPYDAGGEFGAEGIAAARAVMLEPPPTTGLARFRQQLEARQRMAEAEAARYLADPSEIAQVTGRPFVARRSLRPTGSKAQSLMMAAAKARAAEDRAVAEAERRIEQATAPNSKSLAQLGLDALSLDTEGLGYAVPPALAGRVAWLFEGGQAILWRTLPGLPIPPDAQFGYFRTLAPSTVIPAIPPVDPRLPHLETTPLATAEIVEFVRAIRRKFLPNLHRGPIEQWSKAGEAIATELARAYAPLCCRPMLGLHWALGVLCDSIVRGCLLRPDQAAALVHAELLAEHERSTPPSRVFVGPATPGGNPYQGPSLEQISELCGHAAMAGEVEPGSLLPTKRHESKKGK